MTISMNGNDVSEAIEIAMAVGGLVSLLIVGLLIYLVVRPPRRRVGARPEVDAIEVEEMLALIDRMERRLEVLERALPAEERRETRILETGEGPEDRRMK